MWKNNAHKGGNFLFFLIATLLLSHFQPVRAQEDSLTNIFTLDSTRVIRMADSLIQHKQFATAHALLDSAIRTFGFRPEFVCRMVQNALNNYFTQQNFQIFFLRDYASHPQPGKPDGFFVLSLRYPDRWLKKVIEQFPDYALAYKLLGDYYDMRLSQLAEADFIDKQKVKEWEDKTCTAYLKAVKLGMKDANVFRWLGDYYWQRSQVERAKEYYYQNIQNHFEDPLTYFRLSQISFRLKQYNQALQFVQRALDGLGGEEIYMRYEALRLAAQCLLNLGEKEQFLEYINEAIHLIPDQQAAYLNLLDYYDQNQDVSKMENVFREMFQYNPYDRKGYEYLEKFVVKYHNYLFSEKLFERLILRNENSDEALGNIYWSRGDIAYHQGLIEDAQRYWNISRDYFRKYLPPDHPVFKQIGSLANHSQG